MKIILTKYAYGNETFCNRRNSTVWEQWLQDVQRRYQTKSSNTHGTDQYKVRPQANECWIIPKSSLNVNILSSRLGHWCPKFCITQGTQCIVHTTYCPHYHCHAHRSSVHEYSHWRHKDSWANYDANDDGYSLEKGNVFLQWYLFCHFWSYFVLEQIKTPLGILKINKIPPVLMHHNIWPLTVHRYCGFWLIHH